MASPAGQASGNNHAERIEEVKSQAEAVAEDHRQRSTTCREGVARETIGSKCGAKGQQWGMYVGSALEAISPRCLNESISAGDVAVIFNPHEPASGLPLSGNDASNKVMLQKKFAPCQTLGGIEPLNQCNTCIFPILESVMSGQAH